MKKIILSILFLLVTFPMLSQEKILEKVDEGLYEYTVFNNEGEFHQKGFYKKQNGMFIEHGIWRDQFGTKILFEFGKIVWIKPKGDRRYTSAELQIHRLRNRIQRLESTLTSL